MSPVGEGPCGSPRAGGCHGQDVAGELDGPHPQIVWAEWMSRGRETDQAAATGAMLTIAPSQQAGTDGHPS